MGLCDRCCKTFCLDELSTFRDKLFKLKMIEEIEEVDTRFCVECVTHVNCYDFPRDA